MSSSYAEVESVAKSGGTRKIEILEIPLDCFLTSHDWSLETPTISGVMLCYDATRNETLDGIRDCIGQYHAVRRQQLTYAERMTNRKIPTVLLACKSDPGAVLEVDAVHGNELGEAHNVGLIEVSELTSDGRSKMRNALRWLLHKLEQKSRALPSCKS